MGYMSRLPTDNEPVHLLPGSEKAQAAMIRRLRREEGKTLHEIAEMTCIGVEDLKTILLTNSDSDY